jgi:diguanylate cyclase (GGDEF)-like protein
MARYGGALLAGRVGGEEFALYYNDVDRAQLQEAARVIKAALTEVSVPGLPDDYPITVSIGLHMSYSQEALTDMIARADQALYRAKREGKDKAVITAVQLHLAVRNGVTG